jgi:hypothetical protein
MHFYKTLISVITVTLLVYPVFGQEWRWERNDDLLNPTGIKTIGMNSPSAGDFDNDGDIDLIVGCKGGVLQYYENIGTPDSAIWQMDVDYFNGVVLDTTLAPKPQLADLDGDTVRELYLGFTDNIQGMPSGVLLKFINIGSPENPQWQNAGFDIGYDISGLGYPQFLDYDYDGDYDLILHSFDSNFSYFENIGDSHNPVFLLNSNIFDTFSPFGAYVNITLANLCGDNKYELVVVNGYYDGTGDESGIELCTNTGTMENPIWQRPDDPFMMASYLTNVSFADMDNDNDMDMFIGNHRPPLFYKGNHGTPDSMFIDFGFNGERLGPMYVYKGENIHFVDFDNDDDLDFIGFYFKILWPYGWQRLGWVSAINIGNQISPNFSFADSLTSYMLQVYQETFASSGDINSDGFKELILNFEPVSYILNNNGSGYSWGPFYDLGLGDTSFDQNPELIDFNNDGLLDILVRNRNGNNWKCYQNIGTAAEPSWQENPGWIAGIDSNVIAFRDATLNRDSKIDLVGIDGSYHLKGFLNVGSIENPSFICDPQILADLNNYVVTHFDCADLDGDGDDDIVIDSAGVITFVENMGYIGIDENNDNLPSYITLEQNYPNPFNSSTTVEFSIPKAGVVTLEIYNILGRRVQKLTEGIQSSGRHKITWDADNLVSGIYFYRLQTGDLVDIRKMILIK